ncbi:MAG: hypothetical protein U0805_15440 [Pirellulales bacterium]
MSTIRDTKDKYAFVDVTENNHPATMTEKSNASAQLRRRGSNRCNVGSSCEVLAAIDDFINEPICRYRTAALNANSNRDLVQIAVGSGRSEDQRHLFHHAALGKLLAHVALNRSAVKRTGPTCRHILFSLGYHRSQLRQAVLSALKRIKGIAQNIIVRGECASCDLGIDPLLYIGGQRVIHGERSRERLCLA